MVLNCTFSFFMLVSIGCICMVLIREDNFGLGIVLSVSYIFWIGATVFQFWLAEWIVFPSSWLCLFITDHASFPHCLYLFQKRFIIPIWLYHIDIESVYGMEDAPILDMPNQIPYRMYRHCNRMALARDLVPKWSILIPNLSGSWLMTPCCTSLHW